MWDTELLFQKHAQEINRYLRKCGHGRDEAADLTQDVFVRLMGAAQPKHDGNQRAYLYTVARNLSTDFYRRHQAARISNIPDHAYSNHPDPVSDPERAISNRQQIDALRRALEELPPKTRRAFELYRLRDLTMTQVAAELNLSVSRTWALIHQACHHVRETVPSDPT